MGKISTRHAPACAAVENCAVTSSARSTNGSLPALSILYPYEIFRIVAPVDL